MKQNRKICIYICKFQMQSYTFKMEVRHVWMDGSHFKHYLPDP